MHDSKTREAKKLTLPRKTLQAQKNNVVDMVFYREEKNSWETNAENTKNNNTTNNHKHHATQGQHAVGREKSPVKNKATTQECIVVTSTGKPSMLLKTTRTIGKIIVVIMFLLVFYPQLPLTIIYSLVTNNLLAGLLWVGTITTVLIMSYRKVRKTRKKKKTRKNKKHGH